jgi:hypothetical protein
VISIPNVMSGDQAPALSFRIAPISTESWMATEHPAEVQAELMLAFERECHATLHDPRWADERCDAALHLLHSRGVVPAALPSLPVGLFLDLERLKPALLATGANMAAINLSRLLADPRLPGRLVGPIRTVDGRTISFWARDTHDLPPRFLFLRRTWKQAVSAIGLDTALSHGGREDLLLLEDPVDSLMLQSHGLLRVAALAGPFRELNSDRWRALAEAGVRRVTLLVEDYERRHAVASAIQSARHVYPTIEVFVLSLPRLRVWLSGECMNAVEWPDVLDNRVGRERVLGRRYLLQGIKLQVCDVSSVARQPVSNAVPVAAPQPIVAKEPESPPAPVAPPTRWKCDLHQCNETDCFCFD